MHERKIINSASIEPLISFVAVSLLVLSALTMRPSMLGEILTPASMAFAAAAVSVCLLFLSRRCDKKVFYRNVIIASLICILWLYLALHSILQIPKQPEAILKAVLTIPFLVTSAGLLLSNQTLNRAFFRALVWLFIISSISYFATLAIVFFMSLDDLLLFQIGSKLYEEKWGGVYFPFTTAYGVIKIYGFPFFRNLGPFRESGIFQAFLTWSFFALPYLGMNRLWMKAVLLAGLVSTFSTTGIAVFFATLTLKILLLNEGGLRLRKLMASSFLIVIIGAIGALALIYFPVFGLIDKMEKAQVSVSDRIEGTVTGLSGFMDNPIGIGMYNAPDPSVGVNLISASWTIGIIGLLITALIAAVSVITLRRRKDRMAFIVTLFPFAVTGLIAQPFLESPLVFIMLFQILAARKDSPFEEQPISAMSSEEYA